MPMTIAANAEQVARCFDVMRELRPKLSSAEDFVARVQQQQSEGFQLAFLEADDKVVSVAGFRIHHVLVTGLTLHVDDL